jgi:hypothetical protein
MSWDKLDAEREASRTGHAPRDNNALDRWNRASAAKLMQTTQSTQTQHGGGVHAQQTAHYGGHAAWTQR